MTFTDAYAPRPPNAITRQSELGTPTETMPWWAPFGWLLVAVATLIIVALFVVFLPITIIAIIWRRLYALGFKYHRQPAELKVAIVGAGWSGLQCMQRFKELGVTNVDIFERYDDLGGTWHRNLAYHGLQIHGSMEVTSFDNFPYSDNPDVQGGKVLAAEVNRYVQEYAKWNNLRSRCRFNSNVETVKYTSKGRKGTVVITDTKTGEKSESGPYDMVIWASMASYPVMPKIPGAETFKGKQLHTTQYPPEMFEEIVRTGKKVVVVGGGKASADVVLGFRRAGYENFKWVMRKPYLFYKFESLLHDNSVKSRIRGFTYLSTVIWTAVSTKLGALLHWSSGYIWTFGKPHIDFTRFHGGILCPTQRRDLKDIPFTLGEPTRFDETGIFMPDGSHVDCDILIWGTGNKSGIDTLKIEKDGQPFKLDAKAKLYNHFIVPQVPVLASCTALWTTFGPMRGINSAELTVHHLCVREEKTEAQMQASANRQFSTNSLVHSFLWAQKDCWLRQWVYFHVDLVLAGVTPIESFIKHAYDVFVLAKLSPLDLNILPRNARHADKGSVLTPLAAATK